MPSPIGHTLAGVAIALAVERLPRLRPAFPLSPALILMCAFMAAAADLDLLTRYVGLGYTHRTVTHSVMFVALVMIVTAGVTGWVTGRMAWRLTSLVGLVYGSHLLLDWLGPDPTVPAGLQLLWPFSREWFISGATIFLRTDRHDPFSAETMAVNARAAVRELLVLGPIVLALLWARRPAILSEVEGSPRVESRGDSL